MPRVSEFYGVVIYMYWSDHPPAHFHAVYGEHEARIRIDDGTVLVGRLPRRAGHLVAEWLDLRREELAANWARAQDQEPLLPIEPLQ